MIKIEKANKYYNRHKKNELHVINNVSLELKNKGLVALLGPSGSGKTTLLNAIGGLDKIKSGKIYVNNKKITSRIAYKRDRIRNLQIGYIFQDYKLIESLSVFDNVALVLKMIGIKDKKEIKKRVEYVLEKVGMYRYKYRPAGMLSGGEKQRVGIARAIVKAPNIIIADEPTGNLDSQNSLEIMNIIKAISREKLVILVTHESDLARFFADRIIEIQDGKIEKDYINEHSNELDYQIENKFYLKDYKNVRDIKDNNTNIKIYSEADEKIGLDIVVKNGNIYIKSAQQEKIEVVDSNSTIEFIDEHYKKINKEEVESYKFDFNNIINKKIKNKYTSIYNPITMITNGFKSVLNFSILKKILLLGFFASAMFIAYSVSTIKATLNVKDEDFIKYNKNYLIAELPNVKVEDYLTYENFEGVKYLLPGDSIINLNIKYDDFFQTSQYADNVEGSIASLSLIEGDNLIHGRRPETDHEIIVDKMVLEKVLNSRGQMAKMCGINEIGKFLNKDLYVPGMENIKPYTIVGIIDKNSPSIYANDNMLVNIIALSKQNNDFEGNYVGMAEEEMTEENAILDYALFLDKIEVKKGRLPENDYEVIVNISNKDTIPLNKILKLPDTGKQIKVNDNTLKVVGYYNSQYNMNYYFVNTNTVKYNTITEKNGFTVATLEPEKTLVNFRDENLNIRNGYESAKEEYMNSKKETIRNNLTVSGVILTISLIEIFLMIRSSFLSRIREIGILRAIGVKKQDTYKMFIGEIVAITTMASVPGILLMSYILKKLSEINLLKGLFIVDLKTLVLSIVFIYGFNLLIGLLPVFKVVRKTPAEILSRHDI